MGFSGEAEESPRGAKAAAAMREARIGGLLVEKRVTVGRNCLIPHQDSSENAVVLYLLDLFWLNATFGRNLPIALSILQWSDAHVPVELAGECALIVESVFYRDFTDWC